MGALDPCRLMLPEKNPVLLFDGVCNLCNATVQFIINRDRNKKFRFAPLQSVIGQQAKVLNGIPADELESVILFVEGKIYKKSDAALQIARRLDGAWPVFFIFYIVPRFLRDPIYDLVAKYRYKWFGKRDSCMVPDPDLKSRFLS